MDEASTSTICERYDEWYATAEQTEHGTPEKVACRRTQSPNAHWLSPHYKYCLMVDRESLDSIPSKRDPADIMIYGWVKIIDRHWKPYIGIEVRTAHMTEDQAYDALEAFEGESKVYPEIDGSAENDVVWMKMSNFSLMLSDYDSLRDPHLWRIIYRRPPDMPPPRSPTVIV